MNRYAVLRRKQEQEIHALPIGFAFGNRQFEELMRHWGFDPEKDLDKNLPARRYRRLLQADVAQLIRDTLHKYEEELQAAIAEDETGDGFIYEMFLYELDNHEFGYTQDPEDTLTALGYTADEVQRDPRLKRGLEKAMKKINRRG